MKKIKKSIYITLFSISVLLYGCTDLNETVLSAALGEEALEHPEAAAQSLAPVYAGLRSLMGQHDWLHNMQSIAADEQIVPYRNGTDWFDGGRFIEMHQHSWTPTHISINNVWQGLTQGVARAVIAERTVNDLNGPPVYAAEARAMKALYNYWLLDLFNVAFEKKPEDVGTPNLSVIYKDSDAVDYIYREIDAVESALGTRNEVASIRFSRGAAWGLKARLLLNKAVYTDRYASNHSHNTEDLQGVINYTNQIIDSGHYALETDIYFNMWDVGNDNHSEHIFAFDQNEHTGGRNNRAWFGTSRNRHGSLHNLSNLGSDGVSLTQEFYDRWEGHRDDPRYFHRYLPDSGTVADEDYRWNRGIQIGQQYGIVLIPGTNEFYRAENGELEIRPLFNTQRTGEALIYTREVGLSSDNVHVAGARGIKQEPDPDAVSGNGCCSRVNLPWLRLGDVYLMRAEAYARLNDWGSALNDVNELRSARGARLLTANELSTLADIERERIFELYLEDWRRTDQVRFGTWGNQWRDKTNTDVNRRVFPIPQSVIDAAREQPGYLEQNPGY